MPRRTAAELVSHKRKSDIAAWERVRDLYRADEENDSLDCSLSDSDDQDIATYSSSKSVKVESKSGGLKLKHPNDVQWDVTWVNELSEGKIAAGKALDTIMEGIGLLSTGHSGQRGLYKSRFDEEKESEYSFVTYLKKYPTRIAFLASEMLYCMLQYHRWRIAQLKIVIRNWSGDGSTPKLARYITSQITKLNEQLSSAQKKVATPDQEHLRILKRKEWKTALARATSSLDAEGDVEEDDDMFAAVDAATSSSLGKRKNTGDGNQDSAKRQHTDNTTVPGPSKKQSHSAETSATLLAEQLLTQTVSLEKTVTAERQTSTLLTSQLNIVRAESQRLKDENAQLLSARQHDAAEREELQIRIVELTEENSKLSGEKARLVASTGSLHQELKKLRELQKTNEDAALALSSETKNRDIQLKKAREEREAAQKEVAQLQAQVAKHADLEKRLEIFKTQERTLLDENENLKKQNDTLQTEVERLCTNERGLTEQITDLQDREAKTAAEISSLYTQNAELAKRRSSFFEEVVVLRRTLANHGIVLNSPATPSSAVQSPPQLEPSESKPPTFAEAFENYPSSRGATSRIAQQPQANPSQSAVVPPHEDPQSARTDDSRSTADPNDVCGRT